MKIPDQNLAYSIMAGNAQGAKDALRLGADPNLRLGAKQKEAVLIVGIDLGHEDVAKVLLEEGAIADGALHAAIVCSSREFIEYLLSKSPWKEDELGSAMMRATMEGGGWEMSRLLDEGAPIEWRQKSIDITALGWATQGLDTEELVRELLRRGADPCAKICSGRNIWDVAREQLVFHSDALVEAAALSKMEREKMEKSVKKVLPLKVRGL
jgi:hypothetical protein